MISPRAHVLVGSPPLSIHQPTYTYTYTHLKHTERQWSVWPRTLDIAVDEVDQQALVLDRHKGILTTTLHPHADSPSTPSTQPRMQINTAMPPLLSGTGGDFTGVVCGNCGM